METIRELTALFRKQTVAGQGLMVGFVIAVGLSLAVSYAEANKNEVLADRLGDAIHDSGGRLLIYGPICSIAGLFGAFAIRLLAYSVDAWARRQIRR